MVYVPARFVFRLPKLVVTDSPPFAVAPASEYVVPLSTVTGLDPFKVMIGGVISRESSSVSAPKIPAPPTIANADWIILSSANISFNLSEMDFSLAGL